jgi:hypothetical protein
MRQQQAIITPRVPVITQSEFRNVITPIMADSLEVMECYYYGKIQVLENSLANLNLLENAREIAFLCMEISKTKMALKKINLKKNRSK